MIFRSRGENRKTKIFQWTALVCAVADRLSITIWFTRNTMLQVEWIFYLQSRESLVRSLLLDTPSENLKPGPRQQLKRHLKRKLTDHKLEEKEASVRDVEDVALAAMRKWDNNKPGKQVMQQYRKWESSVLLVTILFALIVLTRTITLCNK